MNKAIATTVNDPSTKMRGLSIGIFPVLVGRWRALSCYPLGWLEAGPGAFGLGLHASLWLAGL
jgi:hypothetical protein